VRISDESSTWNANEKIPRAKGSGIFLTLDATARSSAI
jgi:hypothetical protein